MFLFRTKLYFNKCLYFNKSYSENNLDEKTEDLINFSAINV